MDVKLCRICAKQDDNFVHIFQTDGLKNKIETCLPIIVTQHCPLPDTICTDCLETVNNFCTFIERCLRNIAVLETQYDVLESCLLAKRKVDRCVSVDVCDLLLVNSATAIDTYTDEIIASENVPVLGSLVDYECSSSSDTENEDEDTITADSVLVKQEKDTYENEITVSGRQSVHGKDIIDEIVQRKHLKRKHTNPVTNSSSGGSAAKVPRIETAKVSSESSSRRKNKQPKKVEYHHLGTRLDLEPPETNATSAVTCDNFYATNDVLPHLPAEISVTREIDGEVQRPTATSQSDGSTHTCLLCEQRLTGLIALASHMYETHGIDLAQVYSHTNTVPPLPVLTPAPQHSTAVCNKTRKIPELVKISDVLSARINKQKHPPEPKHPTTVISTYSEEPPVLEVQPLQDHRPQSLLRNNSTSAVTTNNQFTCTECTEPVTFSSFREYTTHRRAHHQIFHCDLCPKFYGRNSHLWKHVNRVHKGHPSITCQQCHKTSASEYHLAQHFNKMHSAKPQHHSHYATSNNRQVTSVKIKTEPVNNSSPANADETNELDGDDGSGVMTTVDDEDDLLNQKFQGFDFKSVRQSFLRQELMMNKRHKYVSILKKKNSTGDNTDAMGSKRAGNKNNSGAANNNTASTNLLPNPNAPKEIDSSSDLYTNIITNYTPPTNEGPYKCPKCFKGFHKKNLLKKHKKNCRPRLQKDLLTRCKTCSRIFKDRQSLAKHLVNYHSEYTCEICGVAVQSKCEIVSHIRFTHPGSPDLQCHCGQILRSRADLARHKADHRDSHVCQFCGDALPTKIKLKMHILSLHRKILSLSCGICLKLFETQHILKEHVRLVHGDQLQPLTSCTVCGKNYGSKWKTYDHLNKSHGRIFKACKACLDVFETERELQAHFEKEHLNTAAGTGGSGSKHNQQQQPQQSSLHVQLKLEENTPVHSANVTDNENDEEEDDEGVEEDVEMPVLDEEDTEGKQKSTETKQQSVQNGFYRKQQPPPVVISSVQENKLSLLEKRLLGRKVSEEEQTSKSTAVAVAPKSSTTNNRRVNTNKNTSTLQDVTEPPVPPPPTLVDKNAPIQVDTPTSSSTTSAAASGDILQNSSKRTVYVNSNDPSLCEICLKVWPAKKHLWQHYIRCHKQVAATVCGICLKTNPSYSSLQTHLRDTHPHLLHGCGFGSNFICKICGRYHNASSKLKLHMAIHVGFTESALLVVDTNSNGSNSNLTTDNKQHDKQPSGRKHQQQQQQQRQLQQQPPTSDNDEEEIIDEDGEEEYGEEVEEYEQDTETNNNQSGSDEVDENEEHILMDDLVIVKHELPDHPDYESLIEEIEASSDEEEEDEATDQQHNAKNKYVIAKQEPEEETALYKEPKREDTVQTTDDNDDEESEEEEDNEEDDGEVLMETDMEQEMLKNMIGESLAVVHVKREKQSSDNEEEEVEDEERSDTEYGEEVDVKLEVCSSAEELDDDDDDDDDEEWTTAQDDEEHQLQQQRLFDRRPEELDDAIRSISYEQCDSDDNMNGSNPGLYSDQLSTASGLTESELETAVGSIL